MFYSNHQASLSYEMEQIITSFLNCSLHSLCNPSNKAPDYMVLSLTTKSKSSDHRLLSECSLSVGSAVCLYEEEERLLCAAETCHFIPFPTCNLAGGVLHSPSTLLCLLKTTTKTTLQPLTVE